MADTSSEDNSGSCIQNNGDNNSAVETTSTSSSSDATTVATTGATGAAPVAGQKTSVFGDFQRMWMQRFPQSSLSDAWELDVRASLQRHRHRIGELSAELEQERLYVAYLEQLLCDVERQRNEVIAAAAAGAAAEATSSTATTATTLTTSVSSCCREGERNVEGGKGGLGFASGLPPAHTQTHIVDKISKVNVFALHPPREC